MYIGRGIAEGASINTMLVITFSNKYVGPLAYLFMYIAGSGKSVTVQIKKRQMAKRR